LFEWGICVNVVCLYASHMIFVTKLWVISKKLTQIMKARADSWFTWKANLLFYGQIIGITICEALYSIKRLWLGDNRRLGIFIACEIWF